VLWQRLVQSGFYEVALTLVFRARSCHATSQNPQDSHRRANVIQDVGWVRGQPEWHELTLSTCVSAWWRRWRMACHAGRSPIGLE